MHTSVVLLCCVCMLAPRNLFNIYTNELTMLDSHYFMSTDLLDCFKLYIRHLICSLLYEGTLYNQNKEIETSEWKML